MKVKESFERQGKLGSEITGDLKENRVTLDVTSAWKSSKALKLMGNVENQGKL